MYLFGRFITLSECLRGVLVILSAFNLLLLRTLFRKPRAFWQLCKVTATCFNEYATRDGIPTIAITELLQERRVGDIWVDLSNSLGVTCQELLFLCALLRDRKPKRILEIGTYRGVTAYHMARNSGDHCRIFTIDLPPDYDPREEMKRDHPVKCPETAWVLTRQIGREAFRRTDVEHKITQIYGDSTQYDFDENFPEPFDFIFVDGSHDYEHVRKDSLNALRHLKPGGIVLWHDCGPGPEITYGVRKCLMELRAQHDIRRLEGTNLGVWQSPSRDVLEPDAARGVGIPLRSEGQFARGVGFVRRETG